MSDSLFKSFTHTSCPRWRCPDCLNETLAIDPESFTLTPNGETVRSRNEEWFDAIHVRLIFSCVLRCQRSECAEAVAVTGTGRTFEDNSEDHRGAHSSYINVLTARTFYPPIPLFIPPAGCPEIVLEQLSDISSLLTGHPAAAANAIRSLLEVLLDDLDIPREGARPGKQPRILPLHERLAQHKEKLGDHHDWMMALKVMGNAGSHGGTPIEQVHLEDACAVLEQLLNELYQPKADLSEHLSRLSEAFNKKPKS